MYLNRAVCNSISHFAGIQFRARRRGTQTAGARFAGFFIARESCVMREGATGFNFGLHIREHPLDGLIFGDGFSESAALFCITGGSFHSALRQSDGLSGDAHTPAIEGFEGYSQALAFFTKKILDWHATIVENDFRRARKMQAHFFFVTPNAKAGERRLD